MDRPAASLHSAAPRHERLDAILDLVLAHGSVSVEHLVRQTGVSVATVRRDLDALAAQQLVLRTRGGATRPMGATDLPLRYRAGRDSATKERIAREAAALVTPGSVIAMNGGTTTTAVAHAIATDPRFTDASERQTTTLVTNAINIAQELAVRPHLHLVVTGGIVRAGSFELVGSWGEHLLGQIALDTMVLGANGADVEHGATADSAEEATMAAALAARARRTILCVDSSKLGRRAFALIRPTSGIDVLVTDDQAPAGEVARWRDAGVEVRLTRA